MEIGPEEGRNEVMVNGGDGEAAEEGGQGEVLGGCSPLPASSAENFANAATIRQGCSEVQSQLYDDIVEYLQRGKANSCLAPLRMHEPSVTCRLAGLFNQDILLLHHAMAADSSWQKPTLLPGQKRKTASGARLDTNSTSQRLTEGIGKVIELVKHESWQATFLDMVSDQWDVLVNTKSPVLAYPSQPSVGDLSSAIKLLHEVSCIWALILSLPLFAHHC